MAKRKKKVARRNPARRAKAKKIPPLRQVFFDPKTGKKLTGFNVMTPTGLIMEIPAGWKHWIKE